MVKSGGAVLIIAASQVLVGLCLLGIYEGYKGYYYNHFLDEEDDSKPDVALSYQDPLDWRSPMGASYWVAIINNVFAVFGLAGIFTAQRELIVSYFAYSAVSSVTSFHFFVDLVTDSSIKYKGEPSKLSSYEQATTAFIFINFVLSIAASIFAVKSMEEIKQKQREEMTRFAGLSDTLQYEPDAP